MKNNERQKTKYIVLGVNSGVTVSFEYMKDQKAEAVACFRNIRFRSERAKLFSIDSDDEEIWYDLSGKY